MRSISIASIAGLLAAGFSSAATAQEAHQGMSPFSSVDAFLSYSDLQSDGGGSVDIDDADIGGGMRLRMGFGDLFFIDGGFNSVSVDNPELSSGGSAQDVSVRFREQHIAGGLRYALFDDALVPYITVGEYRPRIRVSGPDSSERISDSSLIFGAGVHYTIMTALHVVGSYRRADDLDQGEFEEIEVGGAYQFARSLAIFATYRMGELSFDNGTGFDSDDIRLGLRFSFDTEGDDENFY